VSVENDADYIVRGYCSQYCLSAEIEFRLHDGVEQQ
jgi:hypothetical protein